jgi:hypothetical protein
MGSGGAASSVGNLQTRTSHGIEPRPIGSFLLATLTSRRRDVQTTGIHSA